MDKIERLIKELTQVGFTKENLELVTVYSRDYILPRGTKLKVRIDMEDDEITMMNWNTIFYRGTLEEHEAAEPETLLFIKITKFIEESKQVEEKKYQEENQSKTNKTK